MSSHWESSSFTSLSTRRSMFPFFSSVLCSVLGTQCFSKERSTVSKILFQIAAIHSAIINAGSLSLGVSFKIHRFQPVSIPLPQIVFKWIFDWRAKRFQSQPRKSATLCTGNQSHCYMVNINWGHILISEMSK